MNTIPYIITNNSITTIVNNKHYVIDKTHPNFYEIKTALKEKDFEKVENLIDISNILTTKYGDKIRIESGAIYYNNEVVHNYIVDRILEFWKNNEDISYLLNFLSRLLENPSHHSAEQLYNFLEHLNMPIDEDGYFYAYKGVTSDFYSVNTGKEPLIEGERRSDGRINNNIGQKIRVERRFVCDNPNIGCSHGLHAGSYDYASCWGERVVIVKIDPKNVVSVPTDCNYQKLRTCAYEVIAECEGKMSSTTCKKDNPFS